MNEIYLNVEIYNDTNKNKMCSYNSSYNEVLISNPDDFQLSVIRFAIPSDALPIFFFEEFKYYVTLTYNNLDYSELVYYSGNTTVNNIKYVFYIQDFLTQVNISLLSAFNALKFANPAAPPTAAPYIIYDDSNNLFKLYCQQSYLNNVKIFMNQFLFSFFCNFNSIHYGQGNANYKDYEIIISDNKNNVDNINGLYWFNSNSLSYWFSLRNIVFFCDGLKVGGENSPSNQTNNISSSSSTDLISVPILTDFQPYYDFNDIKCHYFQYQPSIYRFYDIYTTTDIRNLNIIVKWQDKKGRLFDLYLSPGQIASIKILFKRKFKI